ncbi:MerR family transcriptional regulator [Deinococcus multiflagellatus]|uniref:MerR family transcriptional regulator n=1 Tax=Deinococcus multiflagellatus TaxID=1656887 RepID=A0ABW1ZKF9_9DEIO|nr:MerR family transcriptional regulator [Deinococcus multiflagellatus]MBZ9712459.1 MerR family transcriptional regulator [Deinococcus multiflagellatus]
MKDVSVAEFRAGVQGLREALIGTMPAEQRKQLVVMCGGPDVFEALFDPRGVGIGRFAALMGQPTTTVRHLLREDLLHPMRVNGKFRFLLPNVAELRGVQQWQALGLTLEEVRAFLQGQQLLGMAAQGELTITLHRVEEHPDPEQLAQLKATVLARVQAAIAGLEAKQATLTRQLEQARALAAALAQPPGDTPAA